VKSSSQLRKLKKHEVFRQIEVQHQNEHLLKSLLTIANRKNIHRVKPHPHVDKMLHKQTNKPIKLRQIPEENMSDNAYS